MTQTEGLVTLLEGTELTLNCTYQTSYPPFLYWYIQYQHRGLELLLKSSSETQEVSSKGFLASHVKSQSSFHLRKTTVKMSDSAMYFCALQPQ